MAVIFIPANTYDTWKQTGRLPIGAQRVPETTLPAPAPMPMANTGVMPPPMAQQASTQPLQERIAERPVVQIEQPISMSKPMANTGAMSSPVSSAAPMQPMATKPMQPMADTSQMLWENMSLEDRMSLKKIMRGSSGARVNISGKGIAQNIKK